MNFILKTTIFLKQIQVLLVDIAIGYFCAKENIFQIGSLILTILLLKQNTFSVSDFFKFIYKSEKCQTREVRSHLVSAIHGYAWLWLILL
jgi:hypothetical protein